MGVSQRIVRAVNRGSLSAAWLLGLAALGITSMSRSSDIEELAIIESFPKYLPNDCRGSKARLYNECGSQAEILVSAINAARKSEKTTLLLYGAEWCVWCFILNDTLNGQFHSSYFEYERDDSTGKWGVQEKTDVTVSERAQSLNAYVAQHFVIAHIEAEHAPDGAATVDAIGFDSDNIEFYPFMATLNNNGEYTDHLFGYQVMSQNSNRKDRNGRLLKQFDRAELLRRLKLMRAAAIADQ